MNMKLPDWRVLPLDRFQNRLKLVAGFLILLWVIQLLDSVVLNWLVDWKQWLAVIPRTTRGLPGIATMHLVHDGLLYHLLPNTIPLGILLSLLAVTRRNFIEVAVAIALLGGALLWLVGRPQAHIGASLLIYGLITFHVGTGFFERKPLSMVIGAVVGLLYWWTFVWGILPFQATPQISWDGHLCGALAGLIVAFLADRSTLARRWKSLGQRNQLLPDAPL